MQLCTVHTVDGERPAVHRPGRGAVLAEHLLGRETGDLMSLLDPATISELASASEDFTDEARVIPAPDFAVPYRHPGKTLGIGLNYRSHAADLAAETPRTSPASFFKADHTLVGPGKPIVVPGGIGKVTAEAELGLVIGRDCYQVEVEEAMDYVVGIVAILDQTAEEVLMENPRFLTRVKNYPTFLSFGPVVITLDEVRQSVPDLADLTVSTVRGGEVHRSDAVAGMTFSPAELLSFHSMVMPFHQGDILSTGTPGAVAISPGDSVSCVLGADLTVLTNPVVGAAQFGAAQSGAAAR